MLAGLATGAMSGAIGIGGASLSTPAVRLLGASAYLAVGTTLPSIFPGAAVGTVRFVRGGLVDARAVLWSVPPGLLGAVAGSLASHALPGHGRALMIATAVLLAVSAVRIARSSPPEAAPGGLAAVPAGDGPDGGGPRASNGGGPPRPWVLGAIGLGAGLLSGLLGVGGGTVLVPGLVELGRYPIKTAVATSLVCVGLLAIPSTVAHAALGDIDWRFAAFLTLGVMPGARMGAAGAVRAGEGRFRLAVAGFLGMLALFFGAGEIIALLRR
ncbi:MAG TPA: sulfite exporter TauE/SafE family protein [Acidimicrobiales bacterium]